MASDVLPFATISKYLPKRMKVMSIADVSKNVIVICSSPMEPSIGIITCAGAEIMEKRIVTAL
jgi:hypothetical protein